MALGAEVRIFQQDFAWGSLRQAGQGNGGVTVPGGVQKNI